MARAKKAKVEVVETPEAPVQQDTNFLKVTREQFDKVLRVGTPEFIAKLPDLTVEQLQRGERWINDIRNEKGPRTYLVFPVRQEKQLAAGKLYLKALNDFRKAVRDELAARAVADIFAAA
jgi:hypothetical protein